MAAASYLPQSVPDASIQSASGSTKKLIDLIEQLKTVVKTRSESSGEDANASSALLSALESLSVTGKNPAETFDAAQASRALELLREFQSTCKRDLEPDEWMLIFDTRTLLEETRKGTNALDSAKSAIIITSNESTSAARKTSSGKMNSSSGEICMGGTSDASTADPWSDRLKCLKGETCYRKERMQKMRRAKFYEVELERARKENREGKSDSQEGKAGNAHNADRTMSTDGTNTHTDDVNDSNTAESDDPYFSAEAIKSRHPELYDKFIGRFGYTLFTPRNGDADAKKDERVKEINFKPIPVNEDGTRGDGKSKGILPKGLISEVLIDQIPDMIARIERSERNASAPISCTAGEGASISGGNSSASQSVAESLNALKGRFQTGVDKGRLFGEAGTAPESEKEADQIATVNASLNQNGNKPQQPSKPQQLRSEQNEDSMGFFSSRNAARSPEDIATGNCGIKIKSPWGEHVQQGIDAARRNANNSSANGNTGAFNTQNGTSDAASDGNAVTDGNSTGPQDPEKIDQDALAKCFGMATLLQQQSEEYKAKVEREKKEKEEGKEKENSQGGEEGKDSATEKNPEHSESAPSPEGSNEGSTQNFRTPDNTTNDLLDPDSHEHDLREELLFRVRRLFLDGEEGGFDYTKVDENDLYDDLARMSLDDEEAWFEDDEDSMDDSISDLEGQNLKDGDEKNDDGDKFNNGGDVGVKSPNRMEVEGGV